MADEETAVAEDEATEKEAGAEVEDEAAAEDEAAVVAVVRAVASGFAGCFPLRMPSCLPTLPGSAMLCALTPAMESSTSSRQMGASGRSPAATFCFWVGRGDNTPITGAVLSEGGEAGRLPRCETENVTGEAVRPA